MVVKSWSGRRKIILLLGAFLGTALFRNTFLEWDGLVLTDGIAVGVVAWDLGIIGRVRLRHVLCCILLGRDDDADDKQGKKSQGRPPRSDPTIPMAALAPVDKEWLSCVYCCALLLLPEVCASRGVLWGAFVALEELVTTVVLEECSLLDWEVAVVFPD